VTGTGQRITPLYNFARRTSCYSDPEPGRYPCRLTEIPSRVITLLGVRVYVFLVAQHKAFVAPWLDGD